jgi:hypothetical protein
MKVESRSSRRTKSRRLTLAGWSVWELQLAWRETRTGHLLGRVLEKHCGEVSSPIVTLDPTTRVATVESGRVYELLGPPGADEDALYRLDGLVRMGGAAAARNVTAEFAACLGRPTGVAAVRHRPALITAKRSLKRKANLQLQFHISSSSS